MEDLALQPKWEIDWATSEPPWLAELRQEVAEPRTEVAQLRRENLELRQQPAIGALNTPLPNSGSPSWNRKLPNFAARIVSSKINSSAEVGRKPATDRSNQLDDPDDTPKPQPRGQRRGQPGPKRRDYSRLPEREDLRELPESERVCPICGQPLTACGAEESEQIEIETQIYRRIIRRRRYQRNCTCPGPRTITAPGVPKLIPKVDWACRSGSKSAGQVRLPATD